MSFADRPALLTRPRRTRRQVMASALGLAAATIAAGAAPADRDTTIALSPDDLDALRATLATELDCIETAGGFDPDAAAEFEPASLRRFRAVRRLHDRLNEGAAVRGV